jgi:hypothetical protein
VWEVNEWKEAQNGGWFKNGVCCLTHLHCALCSATAAFFGHLRAPIAHTAAAGLLSLDVDGRVVRVDTFAKLLGPGYRLGWVSGPPAVVQKLALHFSAVSVGACSLSQVGCHQRHHLCCYKVALRRKHLFSSDSGCT